MSGAGRAARLAGVVLGAVLCLGLPGGAGAQSGQGTVADSRLYVGPGFLIGSPRMVALGGAYTGIAEGVPGFTANLAAVAHRAPQLERNWDLGFGLTWVDVPLLDADPRDLDNDGRADRAVTASQYLFGLLLQYQRYGFGTSLRTSAQRYCFTQRPCTAEDEVEVRLSQTALAAGVAFGEDDFILGVGFYAANASFAYRGQTWAYGGAGVELDALYRPRGRSWRLGVSMKPQVVGAFEPASDGQGRAISGRALYAAIVSPGSLSIGGSVRLGEGSERYNRLSPAARRAIAERSGTAGPAERAAEPEVDAAGENTPTNN